MICINKSEEIGWPPSQNVLCHFPRVVIPGPVVYHIDEGLGRNLSTECLATLSRE
jgi:hypothetical protein